MKSHRIIRAMRCRGGVSAGLLAALLAGAAGGLAGCGGSQPDFSITSLSSRQTFHEPFTHAFSSRRNGDLEIVLADDAAIAALSGHPAGSPVRQILHIHVLWHPTDGNPVRAPSVTNATLHWYVIADPATRPGDVLEYTGTAFVVSDGDPQSPTIELQNASLKCVYQHGLSDPLGRSRLNGSVTAKADDDRVADLLHEVELAAAVLPGTQPATPTAEVGQ